MDGMRHAFFGIGARGPGHSFSGLGPTPGFFDDLLKDALKNMPKPRMVEPMTFDTEDHALKHASALAALQPGAEILIKAKGEAAQRAVYMAGTKAVRT